MLSYGSMWEMAGKLHKKYRPECRHAIGELASRSQARDKPLSTVVADGRCKIVEDDLSAKSWCLVQLQGLSFPFCTCLARIVPSTNNLFLCSIFFPVWFSCVLCDRVRGPRL